MPTITLPPKENALFKRILVGYMREITLASELMLVCQLNSKLCQSEKVAHELIENIQYTKHTVIIMSV